MFTFSIRHKKIQRQACVIVPVFAMGVALSPAGAAAQRPTLDSFWFTEQAQTIHFLADFNGSASFEYRITTDPAGVNFEGSATTGTIAGSGTLGVWWMIDPGTLAVGTEVTFLIEVWAPGSAVKDSRRLCLTVVGGSSGDAGFRADAFGEAECSAAIPTVSEWGLIVFTLLLLTAGTVVLGRRRGPAAA